MSVICPCVSACPTKVRLCSESPAFAKMRPNPWDSWPGVFRLVCLNHFVSACRLLSLSWWFSTIFFFFWKLRTRQGHAGRGFHWRGKLRGSDLPLWESDCDGSHGQFEISRLKSVTSAEADWIRFGTRGLFTISGLHYCGSEPESKVAVKVPVGRASLGRLKQFCWVVIWKSHDWHQTGCFPLAAPQVSPER